MATGGMAELFLGVARAEGFERTVAIKRVLPQLAQEPDIARMFLAEARLAMLLQHQNIATVYDVGQDASGLFLVMELVDGWDLGVLLRAAARQGPRFPPHLAAFVSLQVLAGLSHAYRKQHDGRPVMVAHRDVSPSNVLVSREGEVKVTDFGIARLGGGSYTEPGIFRGKEAYSAPEVLQGAPATAASDQFSLGLVMYELLAGRHPFHEAREPMAVAYSLLSRPLPPLPADVPAPLAATVLRMLSRAPEERFPSPEAVGETLARWLALAGEPASSHALADFLRTLKLPPTLKALGEADGASRAVVPPVAPAAAFQWTHEEQGPGEAALPGGPALSASGRVVHSCARCGFPLSATHAPCDHCAEELAAPSPTFAPAAAAHASRPSSTLPMGRVRPATEAVTRASVPGASPPSARVSASASVTRPSAPAARVPPSPFLSIADTLQPVPEADPMKSVLQIPAESLELVERAPRPESDWPEAPPPSRKRWGRAVVLLAVVAGLAGTGAWLWKERSRVQREVVAALNIRTAAPMLTITSEPSGATVRVDGKDVGTTPVAMENLYPDNPIPVQLRHKGYRPWNGTFRGGEPVQLEVRLER
nr:serine/threonine-protein kinase [Pyxidicoccus fallax]